MDENWFKRGMNDLLRAHIEAPHMRSMWGQPCKAEPKLVSQVFGNGQQWICLTPINTRPNYYVVRVDSSWRLSNYAEEGELLIEHLDEIYDAIEEQFGSSYDEETGEHHGWPALSEDSGSSWGSFDPTEVAA